jgi:two-component system, NarL family, nitrate/nitrite response regulator NarL
MTQAVAAMIVARTGAFRDALESNLRPAGFHIVASKANVTDASRSSLPQFEPSLVVIECGESLGPYKAQIAEIKQQNPLARVVVVGQHWTPGEIAIAFEAGANAYFAEAAVSKEFMQAVNLITR